MERGEGMNFESVPVLTGVQPDHYDSHLHNFEARYDEKLFQKLLTAADQIINDKFEQRYLFLCGSPGSGKTHFLVGLFRARVAKDKGVMGSNFAVYIQFLSLITEIIEGFQQTHSTRIGLLPYLTPRFLFMDDISKSEKIVDPVKMEFQVLKDILLDRFENKRVLVSTTNFSSSELKRMIRSAFGEYVASRIESTGDFIDFPKQDFRRSK